MAGFKSESFKHVVYFSAGATGSGGSASDPAPISAKDCLAIPAGTVIDGVDVIVTTAVTGSSPQLNVGDDDDADGYVADANVTEGTPAHYVGAGAYVTGGIKKYYSATGKEVKFALGGTASAGAFMVVISGYRL